MKRNIIFLVLAVIAFILDNSMSLTGVTLAMAGTGLFDTSDVHFRRALSAKMSQVSWNKSIWSNFMGKIRGNQSPLNPVTDKFGMSMLKPTGSPIEVLEDFASVQTIALDIPVFYPIGGYGVTGREIGTGKGQRAKLGNISVEINTKMQVFNPIDHKMSKYSMNKSIMQKNLLMRSHEYLTDWFSRYFAYQPYPAFLEGASDNLTDSANGVGVTKKSHMNIYVADSSADGLTRVPFSNTKATYEAAVKAALVGLTDTATDYMSTAFLEALVYHASHDHRIAKVNIAGENLYIIVISDSDAIKLQQDSTWNDRMTYAAERSLTKNPLFTGRVAGVYAGALILIDDTTPSAYTTGDSEYSNARSTTGNANGVCYGSEGADGKPDYMDNPVDSGHKKPSILFGKSALALGKIDEIGFNEEKSNFGNYQEIAADCTFGFKRADIIDPSGAYWGTGGDFRHECVSSLIGFTYS